MNNLLLFFALPIATIILASVLETILHCPIKIAAIFFAIFLVVAFTAFDETFLIYVILYTILAFISAFLTRIIIKLIRCERENSNTDIETTSATVNALNATINTNRPPLISENSNSCGCNTRYRRY